MRNQEFSYDDEMTPVTKKVKKKKKGSGLVGRIIRRFFLVLFTIILFGGLTKAGELIMRPIRESLDRNIMNNFRGKTDIIFSQLKEGDAAVLGASG